MPKVKKAKFLASRRCKMPRDKKRMKTVVIKANQTQRSKGLITENKFKDESGVGIRNPTGV